MTPGGESSLSPEFLELFDSGASSSIARTIRAVRKARLWCQPISYVVDGFVEDPLIGFDERRLVMGRLAEDQMAADEVGKLRALVVRLEREGLAPGRAIGPRFAVIGEVIGLLDRGDRVPRCLGYLRVRRWQARAMACRLLRDEPLSETEAAEVVAAVSALPQQLTVELAARKADRISTRACTDVVLPALKSPYWQSRVIEELLTRPNAQPDQYAKEWSMGTLWAAARTRNVGLLPLIRPYLPGLTDNWDLLPIVTWALGRLAAQADLDELVRRLEATREWTLYQAVQGDRPPTAP